MGLVESNGTGFMTKSPAPCPMLVIEYGTNLPFYAVDCESLFLMIHVK